MPDSHLISCFSSLPLVAILRGITPDATEEVIGALFEAGFRSVEVPLNSPEPYKSIEIAQKVFGDDMLVGAGTVLSREQVNQVFTSGGQFIVSPNTNLEVIKHSKKLGMYSLPGVNTPSEAFSALEAGADMLKIFPAEAVEPKVIKAWRAVLPKETWLIPVGGISPDTMEPYFKVGANGFGLGSALYKSGDSIETITRNAQKFVEAYQLLVKNL